LLTFTFGEATAAVDRTGNGRKGGVRRDPPRRPAAHRSSSGGPPGRAR